MQKFTLPLAIIIAAAIVAGVAHSFLSELTAYNQKRARDMAVDSCMQNATLTWQEKRKEDPTLLNTNVEPNRFWYKLCMQEKGYDVLIEL